VSAVARPPECDAALARASLAVDGELDDVGRAHLARHLDRCADCRWLARRMEAAAELLRQAPPEPVRCTLHRARLLRSTSSTRGRHWAGAAVAVVAIVLVTGALPAPSTTRPPARTAARRAVIASLSPLALPIGQRSAMDDFAAPTLPGGVLAIAPRHVRG
jgi:anti-sigma factor RsiW